MCSEPITAIDKQSGEAVTFACRTCNECIAARRSGWIDRGMAERACHTHSLCVTLTYNTETEENRDARRMFHYADVMAFLKRLRRAASYMAEKNKWNVVPYVRFICAGEQGERGDNHCHWHLILYANFDVRGIGEFHGMVDGKKRVLSYPVDEQHMMTIRKRKRRLDWSVWGKGFVTLGEADLAGMHYVLSYCLKDQFAAEKAEGTMREAKSEAFATGLFRMSKRPAIGEEYVVRKMEGLLAKGAVLPSLMIAVPDVRYEWWPTGAIRERCLWYLTAVNRQIRWTTGRDAPQWSSLLASVSENLKELEILNGKEIDPEEISLEAEIAFRQREREGDRERTFAARRKSYRFVCEYCLVSDGTDEGLLEKGIARYLSKGDRWLYYDAATGVDAIHWARGPLRFGQTCRCEICGGKDRVFGFPGAQGESEREA